MPLRDFAHGTYLHVGGTLLGTKIETSHDPLRIDHVWIDIATPEPLRLSINTVSRRNRDAGFDGRIRVGVIRDTWRTVPELFVERHPGLNYATFEETNYVFYECYTAPEMEGLLISTANQARFIEAWGEFYYRKSVGIHQIHSRRASCAVDQDLIGHDGAIRFHLADANQRVLMLLKFCGQ